MHPEEAELRELLEDLAREDALLEPVADLVEDVVAHELAHGVADRALLVVEERVDREVVERVEGRDARWSSPCRPTSYGTPSTRLTGSSKWA